MRLPWRRHPTTALRPRPDYTAIAVLEHDLFGIQPEPGTAAAAIIGMRHLQRTLSPRHVGPEFGSGLAGRPSPYLLEPGDRLVPMRRRGNGAPGSG
ncbi:hypothetical protein [Streptomyces griseorubiginosus]|uniref:hypothetical protein n=1 Tax=Streptomyces griseorubiginosus TaxID=67304 RepID=UPI003320FC01